ncbi:MAG TPA: hypothetical protein VHD90_26740 [Phototrophicaceae bacterium]|nr:hypothetical protein [Phototrophicaceae bacterium]
MTDFQVLPRVIQRETSLIDATIIYPAVDPVYRSLAQTLANAIQQASGEKPELQAEADLMPTRGTPLADRYRRRTLILLGNLNTNRAVLPLYARYFCATDATYPGGDGYDLRTIVNPYGTGANVILVGGSSVRGVQRAVGRLIDCIAVGIRKLPFLLDVELEPSLAHLLAEWPDAPLKTALDQGIRKTHQLNEDVMKLIGAYGIMYVWTGDRHYGDWAAELLKALNAQMTDSYGDWHYRAERMLCVIPGLMAGGFLDAAEVLRTDQLLLGTALGTAEMWWRMRSGDPPLGHRHHGRGTFEFLLLARYLKEQANPNDGLRAQCDRWIAETSAYLDGLGRAATDDQDDESMLTNVTTVFWYALGSEKYDFFESGNARRFAERALARHDNLGANAGSGGYGESFPGAYVLQQEATVPLAASAFYYSDGGLKWVLETLPNLKTPLISGYQQFSPVFMHMFHTGDELPAVPLDLSGIRVLPILPYQQRISTTPPEHIEPLGHAINAPETWRRGEGIGLNRLPLERGFDKVVMRGGFTPDASYLLLQGYQGGFRWQGFMQAANCIIRFSQFGHIFLIQNTQRHSHYQKNGLFISDGFNDTPIPPIAEWIAAADFDHVGLSVTRLSDFHHADWTRHIFWSKRGDGLFVVIDSARFQQDGDYSLTCTWRTPGYARLSDRSWATQQGDHTFTLRWSESLSATSGEETDQGSVRPYVLRQQAFVSRAASFRPIESVFQNLFYVRPTAAPAAFDLHKLSDTQALVSLDGQPFAWCAIANSEGDIRGLGMSLHAISAYVSRDEIAIAGLTSLDFSSEHLASERPLHLSLDFAGGSITARTETDAPADLLLSLAFTEKLAALLRDQLASLPVSPAPTTEKPKPKSDWKPRASFNGWSLLPKRIRAMTVEANPPPLDGFPDQLIDTVVNEIRQTRQQWPAAESYEITLTLPEETAIDHVTIVGDSRIDPTLRTFHALHADLSVEASSDGFQQDIRSYPVEAEAGVLRYKLFRDLEDRLETRSAPLRANADQIRIRVPAPAAGTPLVLHEIEVYGSEQVVPPIQFMLTADLQSSGQPTALIVTAANELIALSERGDELWRAYFDAPVTHLSTHDLDGHGQRSVCVGVLGGELHIFSASGELQRILPITQMFQQRRDAFFGRVYTIHEVQVWQRDADGRAALVIGGYSAICFLDADFQVIGHSWADGSWQNNILVAPESGDLWVRSGWNHGIGLYAGKPGFEPSGETVTFGGVSQPMFRAIRRVIPFVNGSTVAYEWLDVNILAAAENGVGLLSTETRDWRWLIEGGTPITSCVALNDAVIVGGADGFIAAFAQADGRPLRKLCFGAPITGLAALAGDRLAMATRRGLFLLDADWQTERVYAHPVARLLRLSDDRLMAAREDGILDVLEVDQ